jgi:hypothetical protein
MGNGQLRHLYVLGVLRQAPRAGGAHLLCQVLGAASGALALPVGGCTAVLGITMLEVHAAL